MPDDAQAMAVHELNRTWLELIQRFKASKKAFRRFRRQTSPKGVYMWGGVGRARPGSWISFMSRFHFAAKPVCTFTILCSMCIVS